MKVIVGDVVIESDGPLLITPIPSIEHTVERPVPDILTATSGLTREQAEVVHKRRSPRRRNTLVCRGCGTTFRGRKNQMFHDSYCKQQFYRRMKRPQAEPLGIHAGATGVQVRP